MKLFVREAGSGDRVAILIHGGTGDSGTWFGTVPVLVSKGYRVLMPDLRGHGASPRANSYTQDDFADDLVESLPSGAEVIIGHSLGGRLLAVALDQLRPSRAIYLDPGWTMPKGPPTPVAPFRADGAVMSVQEFSEAVPRWSPQAVEQSLSSIAKFDRSRMPTSRIIPDDYQPPVPPPVPSLVVLADPSALVPPAEEQRLRRGGYEFRTVKGAGHVMFADDLEGYLRALEGWV